jgi:hypothetical protein
MVHGVSGAPNIRHPHVIRSRRAKFRADAQDALKRYRFS